MPSGSILDKTLFCQFVIFVIKSVIVIKSVSQREKWAVGTTNSQKNSYICILVASATASAGGAPHRQPCEKSEFKTEKH
jgi:hypothetical protein